LASGAPEPSTAYYNIKNKEYVEVWVDHTLPLITGEKL